MKFISENNKYNSFDIAKLICSGIVVMLHVDYFIQQTNTNILSQINFCLSQSLCRIAVPLFFIFNGFFLYRKISPEKFNINYIKKYFIHVLKLYLIWSLIYFPLNLVNIIRSPEGIIHGVVDYVRKFICVGSYTHLWYLNALLCAVALISFLLHKKWSPRKILYTSFIFYIFGLFGDGYYAFVSPLFKLPFIGKIMNVYFNIFETTRNGLFFAFFFVSLGMILSNKEILISRKKSLLFLIISLLMLCLEIFVLEYFKIAKDYNILLFIIPTVLFVFFHLKTINFKNNTINIRKISALIFYSHMWVLKLILEVLKILGIHIQKVSLLFTIVLTITIFIAVIIIKISNTKRFNWLKHIY